MIAVHGLSKSFGNLKAVDQVDLHVNKGDIMGLVGPDSAGKTTLLRMVCGLIIPDAGKIEIDGHSLSDIDQARENLGYMPQRFSLYSDLTVMENISFFAAMYNLDRRVLKERADEILAITNLSAFKTRLAANLSGGMKQKLSLTCALITRPKILVLDEPTYGVDPESRKEFWKILYRLNQAGMTILVSTAYMDEAELCTRVAFINQGRLRSTDSPANLRANFTHHMLDIRAQTHDPDLLKKIPSILDVSFYGYKYRAMVDDVPAAQAAITDYFQSLNIELLSITEVSPSMEDVFILLAEQGVS